MLRPGTDSMDYIRWKGALLEQITCRFKLLYVQKMDSRSGMVMPLANIRSATVTLNKP